MNPNNPFQQQQKQMQQQRRRQMGAAWMAQQKKKEAENAAAALDPFTRLEQFVGYLRSEYAAGRVTKEQAEAQLRENIITDSAGVQWTVGFETMQWYRAVGGRWEKANRPHFAKPAGTGLPEGIPPAKRHPVKGFFAFLFGCILTIAAGFAAAWFVYEGIGMDSPADLYAAILVWGIGFILSVRRGKKVTRGG